jgi:hypothetical protein
MLFPLLSYGQVLELYTGGIDAKNKDLKFSALIGGNLYLDLFQTQQQGKQIRTYANRILIGFEHSEMMSSEHLTYTVSDPKSTIESCNCSEESLELQDKPRVDVFKHQVRAVSLNAGVEVFKGWYLLTGITQYQHIHTLNKQKYLEYRTIYIDAGIQKVFSIKRWFFIPKIKFNPETTTFAVGVSYR